MSDILLTKLRKIKTEKDTYLLPENIRKDVKILGVTGTLESGAPEDSIKTYRSLDEMQADLSQPAGTRAIVDDFKDFNFITQSKLGMVVIPSEIIISAADATILNAGGTGSTFREVPVFTYAEDGSIVGNQFKFQYYYADKKYYIVVGLGGGQTISYTKSSSDTRFSTFAGTYQLDATKEPGMYPIAGLTYMSCLANGQNLGFLKDQMKYYGVSEFRGVYIFDGAKWVHVNNDYDALASNIESGKKAYSGFGEVIGIAERLKTYKDLSEMQNDLSQPIGTRALVDDFKPLTFTPGDDVSYGIFPPKITISPEEAAIINPAVSSGYANYAYAMEFTDPNDPGRTWMVNFNYGSKTCYLNIEHSQGSITYYKLNSPTIDFTGEFITSESGYKYLGMAYSTTYLEGSDQFSIFKDQIRFGGRSEFGGVYVFDGGQWQHTPNNLLTTAGDIGLNQKAYTSSGVVTGTFSIVKPVSPVPVEAYSTGLIMDALWDESRQPMTTPPNIRVLVDTQRTLDFGDKRYFIIYTYFRDEWMPEMDYEFSRVYVSDNPNAKITLDPDSGTITSDDSSWTRYADRDCIPAVYTYVRGATTNVTLSDIRNLANREISLTPIATNQQINESEWEMSQGFMSNNGYILTNCEILTTSGNTLLTPGIKANQIPAGVKTKNAFGQDIVGTLSI